MQIDIVDVDISWYTTYYCNGSMGIICIRNSDAAVPLTNHRILHPHREVCLKARASRFDSIITSLIAHYTYPIQNLIRIVMRVPKGPHCNGGGPDRMIG